MKQSIRVLKALIYEMVITVTELLFNLVILYVSIIR